jgi:hypothetical protein
MAANWSAGNLLLAGRAFAVVTAIAPPGAVARDLAIYGLSWGDRDGGGSGSRNTGDRISRPGGLHLSPRAPATGGPSGTFNFRGQLKTLVYRAITD